VGILRRIAIPFFLFSATLCGLLVLSWVQLMPRLTRVEVGGKTRDAAQMRGYKVQLAAQIQESEDKRRDFALPLRDADYDMLKEMRSAPLSYEDLRHALFAQAAAIVEHKDAVVIQRIDYAPLAKTVRLTGDVRNVESRSMTVLAEFTESVRQMPFVASVAPPRFERQDDAKTGAHSPFDFTLTLR
jgi:hypothetical protein